MERDSVSATPTNKMMVQESAKENRSMKTVSAFEAAQSFSREINKMCNRRLASGKMIDEDNGRRKTWHGCAEEIMQDVALKLFETYGNEIDMDDPEVSIVARRCANTMLKREQRSQDGIASAFDLDLAEETIGGACTILNAMDAKIEVENMLSYMPPEVKKAFVMYHDLDMSLDAIAKKMKRTRKTVTRRVRDGVEIASQYLSKHNKGGIIV